MSGEYWNSCPVHGGFCRSDEPGPMPCPWCALVRNRQDIAELVRGRQDIADKEQASYEQGKADALKLDQDAEAWMDAPLPEDAEIDRAFPTRSGSHAEYAEAMRLVGARRSKAGLVALVNWLLLRIGRAKGTRRTLPPRSTKIPAVCRACGEPLLLENLFCEDGCPCNSPRGVNFKPEPCAECDEPCSRPGHHIGALFGAHVRPR